MGEFVAAKRRFVVHLRAEDLHEALARSEPDGQVPVEALADALGQLVEWGNLRADPDTSRVTTVEDFHRARFLYQLTHPGEAAERALAVYDEQLGRRGALQAVALADIATQLRALRELAIQSQPDPGRVGLLLRDFVARFTDLADNAQAFMGSLQRTIDLYDADVEAFRAYKDHLVDYLERFIKDLVTVGGEISGLLGELEDAEVSARLLGIAARRDAEPGRGRTRPQREVACGRQVMCSPLTGMAWWGQARTSLVRMTWVRRATASPTVGRVRGRRRARAAEGLHGQCRATPPAARRP